MVLHNVARILELAVPLMDHPAESFLAQLEEDMMKLVLKHGMLVIVVLDPPVPLAASVSVTGDPAGSMPADIHLCQVFVALNVVRYAFFSLSVFLQLS